MHADFFKSTPTLVTAFFKCPLFNYIHNLEPWRDSNLRPLGFEVSDLTTLQLRVVYNVMLSK